MKKISCTLIITILAMLLTACGASAADISSDSNADTDTAAVVYEQVEVMHYENGAPYLHTVFTNRTAKTIASVERAMLAWDENGQPCGLRPVLRQIHHL